MASFERIFNHIMPHVRAHAFICASKLRFSSFVVRHSPWHRQVCYTNSFLVLINIVMHSCSQY